MLRRVAYPVLLGCLLGSVVGCSSLFEREQREPWRAQAEAACLASGQVHQTAGIRIARSISGPGICGLDHPFKVTALDAGAAFSPAYAAMTVRQPPQSEALPSEAPTDAPSFEDQPPQPLPDDTTGGIGADAPLSYSATQGTGQPVAMDRSLVLACSMIPALTRWLIEDVQPAALTHFGSPVVEMTTFGSYSCRRRLNRRYGRMSEHAFGNAVDVKGFRLADGRETRLLSGWRGTAQEQAFWRDITYGGCSKFATVLGPGSSDGSHENHLHLDLARHSMKRQMRVCRPRVPSGWVAAAQRNNAAPAPADYTGSIAEPAADDNYNDE